MVLALILLTAGAALVWRGVLGLRVHDFPRIRTDDPSKPDTEPSSGRSWLAGTVFVVGLFVLATGGTMALSHIATEWTKMLLAGLLVVAGAGLDLTATVRVAQRFPEQRLPLYLVPSGENTETWIYRFLGLTAIGIAQDALDLSAGLVLVLAVWLLPSVAFRYAHNARLGPES